MHKGKTHDDHYEQKMNKNVLQKSWEKHNGEIAISHNYHKNSLKIRVTRISCKPLHYRNKVNQFKSSLVPCKAKVIKC